MKRYDRDVMGYGKKPEGKQCRDCAWYGDERCDLFTLVNNHLSNVFDLNIRVEPSMGCSAMQPEDESQKREKRLAEAEL